MGLFKSLVDRMKATRQDLQRRAAKKAARLALDTTARVARGALDSVGDAMERAMFGDVEKSADRPSVDPAARAKTDEPDPFARLKAAEAEEAARNAKSAKKVDDSEGSRAARLERDVDAEMAALKKRLGK